jgi:hypothetical protein
MDLRSVPQPSEKGGPWLDIKPTLGLKIAGAIVLMTLGLYYLDSGRERASLNRMVLGALLALASLFVFV